MSAQFALLGEDLLTRNECLPPKTKEQGFANEMVTAAIKPIPLGLTTTRWRMAARPSGYLQPRATAPFSNTFSICVATFSATTRGPSSAALHFGPRPHQNYRRPEVQRCSGRMAVGQDAQNRRNHERRGRQKTKGPLHVSVVASALWSHRGNPRCLNIRSNMRRADVRSCGDESSSAFATACSTVPIMIAFTPAPFAVR